MRSLPLAIIILGGIVAIGVAIGGTAAILVTVLIAAAFVVLAWWAGPSIVGRLIGAQSFAGGEPPPFQHALAAIQPPGERETATLRADSSLPNAVALGDGRIVLSDSLLHTLSEDELQAVLRHLHARSDARGSAAAAVLLLPVMFLAALLKSLFMLAVALAQSGSDALQSGASAEAQGVAPVLAGLAVGPIARLLLLFGASRSAVWSADAAAAPLTRQQEALIGALEKIDRVSQPPILFGTARYSLISLFWNHLFFANPLDHTALQRFSLLPPSRARIARLRGVD